MRQESGTRAHPNLLLSCLAPQREVRVCVEGNGDLDCLRRRRRAVMLCSPWLRRSQSSAGSLVEDVEVEKSELGRNRRSGGGVVIFIARECSGSREQRRLTDRGWILRR